MVVFSHSMHVILIRYINQEARLNLEKDVFGEREREHMSKARGVCPNCGALSQLRRSFIEFSGNLKHPVEIRGIRWKSKKSFENAWNSTEIHGKQMEIFGIRWKTMESGGV